jgi:Ca2+-binding RTX toxin-like protein
VHDLAKITYTGLFHGLLAGEFEHDRDFVVAVNEDGTGATVTSPYGHSFALTGENLAGDGELTAGTVTGVSIDGANGDVWVNAEGLTLDAAKISTMLDTKGAVTFIKTVMRGDDRISGSNKSDYLYGWHGNDRILGHGGTDELYGQRGHDVLTGGRGSDNFYFDSRPGHDVVTDFHPHGEHGVEDYLLVVLSKNDTSDVEIVANSHGWAEFILHDGESSITLRGVTLDQLDRHENYNIVGGHYGL